MTSVLRRSAGGRWPAGFGTAVLAAGLATALPVWPAAAFEIFGYTLWGGEAKPPASPDAQTYSIDVAVSPLPDGVEAAVQGASLLYAEKDDEPPPSTPAFLSRARADYDRVLAALYAEGYYGSSIAITVGGRPVESIEADAVLPHPVPVRISVDPGPRFNFGSVVMRNRAPAEPDLPRATPTPEKLGLVPGGVAKAGIVTASEQAMVDAWRRQAHPKAAPLPRAVTANHKTDRLDVAIGVEPGRPAVFGATTVTGTQDMDPAFVAYIADIEPGTPYSPEAIERALKRLRRLQVFASSRIVEADQIRPDGTLPLTVAVAERPLRIFGAGASYNTLDGLGLEGYWEHRNLFGQAERLRFEGRVAGVDSADPRDFTYLGAVTFIKPGVLSPTTDLTSTLSVSREVYDPYTQNTYRARIGLAHEFFEGLDGKVALNGEYDQVEDNFNDRDLVLASLPSELVYDGTDNRLEPTTGFKAKLSIEPYHEFEYGSTGAFMRADGSTYFAFDEAGKYVIAGRVAVGSILGGAADELPADRLFFAGGGGSVRGYAYRSIGPTLPNGDIVGGLSLAEASLEFRAKVTETIGIVPFIDAGGAFASRYPDLSDDIKVGAGIGVRYYTGLGAIRVDVATPLNPERGDSRFALYIGLGESF